MKNLLATLARLFVGGLVQVACGLALLGLAIMSFSVVSGRPLPVVFALSFGHLVGGASIACFFLAVLLDAIPKAPVAADPSPPRSPE